MVQIQYLIWSRSTSWHGPNPLPDIVQVHPLTWSRFSILYGLDPPSDMVQIHLLTWPPQWGAADAEIKVPFDENTELKRSPFKVWSRSVHSHTCYAYWQEFLPRLFLPFRSIHLHFFQNLSQFFPVLAVANTGSCVGPQNKRGHPVGCRFPCWVITDYN